MRLVSYLLVTFLTFSIGVGLSLPVRTLKAHRIQEQLRREAILRVNLIKMRTAIDQCRAELPFSPRSLRELVDAGCLSEIPLDPMTKQSEWEEIVTDLKGQFDVVILEDVRSKSRAVSSEGNRYNEW